MFPIGQHQHLAAQHLRALLVPQRQILRDRLVLVDAGLDLHRAENQLLLGKLQDDELAQVLAVAARHHQADQVVLVARRERDHEQELRLVLPGQRSPRHRWAIMRLRFARPGRGTARDVPEVLLVVERLRVAHVVGAVDFGLDAEQRFGVAGMRAQIGGHLGGRAERAAGKAAGRRG